ncbi:MAG: AraC family transcriptional regulator [Lentisphaeraceae bacterium]|nr:AraC family transcriptional regulator [Lentisphaeraceae bacterium]
MYNIKIIRCKYRELSEWPNRSLRHFWRLYYNPSSGAVVNGIELNENKIVAIPPGIGAEQILNKPFKHFFVHFTVDYPFDRGDEILDIPINDHLLEKINEILKERQRNQAESSFPLEHKTVIDTMNIITAVLGKLKVDNNEFRDVRIIKAVKAIEKNLDVNFSNERLAEKASLSVNGFARLFKQTTGLTPHQFLLKKRLTQAANLLSETNKSIDEISDLTGFCDRSYFSRLFKREYNIGPGLYRREVLL